MQSRCRVIVSEAHFKPPVLADPFHYRIARNFRWCKFSRKCVRTRNFRGFIFAERKRDALTTPLPDDGHTPYARVPKK